MSRVSLFQRKHRIPAFAALAIAGAVLAIASATEAASAPQGKPNKYVGAAKCKNCHAAAEVGNQYEAWQKMNHAKAFETLASDAAKKIAAEKGIADPQKDDKCLKCHVTAFGVAPELVAKGFDTKLGVQCEACHGPGEAHMKARLAAAAAEAEGAPKTFKQVPAEEIGLNPGIAACTKCHNSESPTFKSFCFPKFAAKTRHLHPGKPRTDEEKKKLEAAGCGDACKCTDGCPNGTCGACPEDK